MTWLAILGVIVLIVVAALFQIFAAIGGRKRTLATFELAVANGFKFDAAGGGVSDALSAFPLFQQGDRRHATNLMSRGQDAATTWVFEYSYTTGSSRKNRHTYLQTVIAFPYLDASFPEFQLRTESFGDRLVQVFGAQDIDIVEHPVFSKRFVLRGVDVPTIRMLFDEQVVRALESTDRLCIEGAGLCLLFYFPRRVIEPAQWLALLENRSALRDRFVQSAARLL